MKPKLTRRKWFRNCALAGAGSAAAAVPGVRPVTAAAAAPAVVGNSNISVKSVEEIFIDLPFKPVPKRHQYREFNHEGRRFKKLYRAHLANGVTGIGEGSLGDGALKRVVGQNAADHMWDDSVGSGLQIALFDAVAKTNGVPIHRLLGNQVRDRAFMSWWAVDMPGKDWALECKETVSKGYTSFKGKARSWFDLFDQCDVLTPTLPKHFKIDFRLQLIAARQRPRRAIPGRVGALFEHCHLRDAHPAARRGGQQASANEDAHPDRHALRQPADHDGVA